VTTDPIRWAWAAALLLAWLGLIALIVVLKRRARRPVQTPTADGWTVVFASQTGFAEELAVMTAETLRHAGKVARLVSIADLDLDDLKQARHLLWIVSTTGEGDAPDSAARFVRRAMATPAELDGVSFGLLSLGDRTYRQYCGFGRALDGWLRRSGASVLFNPVEVDNGDAGAIRHWQHQVGLLTGSTARPDWVPAALDRWTLIERRLLNPGSPGGQAWHLAFQPLDSTAPWQAGDIAEIGVPVAAGHDQTTIATREYSVASLPSDGRIELLVRLMMRPDGTPGLASGWLTQEAAIGDEVALRVRTNRGFHGPSADVPLILIGNGTGLAGLRAHLKARALSPNRAETWLLFGERTSAHDAFYDEDLTVWRASGVLTRLDRAFSRDPSDGRYVQHLVAEQATEIAAWVERGAVILVCGSLEGMAPGVHAALEAALGAERLIEMTETGRYRRDVY
jgi:sulfite reductase (NADPH) flavoprotein alpha-component